MNKGACRVGLAAVVAIAAAVFWLTAYPTITWWDSSRYSLAAGTLGVTGPPGSLLLTLLGWPLTKLAQGVSVAYALNLFAGLLGALTVGLVYSVALRCVALGDSNTPSAVSRSAVAGAALGALTFAFSATLWGHAVMFTPYVLTALFTALILYTMLAWWQSADRPDSWRWLLLLGFLFGLDFSVHRTNSLLIPGALAWNWNTDLHAAVGRDYVDQEGLSKLLQKAGVEIDPPKRLALYDEAHKLITQNAYWLPLWSYAYFYAMTDELQFQPTPDEIPHMYRASWK